MSEMQDSSKKTTPPVLSLAGIKRYGIGIFAICLGFAAFFSLLQTGELSQNKEGLLGSAAFIGVGIWYIVKRQREK